MKSKVNPSVFMLDSFKRKVGDDYEKMFLKSLSRELKVVKLEGFCFALTSMLELKGLNWHLSYDEDTVSIYNDSVLYMTYDVDVIEKITNPQSLKFQMLIEWGSLLKFSTKKQLLIAL